MRRSLAIARQPLQVASMIPLSAAGRQPLFFFGTLMDLDVLAYLLERPIDLDDLAPARLDNFVRRQARAASYPVLVPDPSGIVEGVLLRRATQRDIVRINHYESEEYRAELHAVRASDGTEQAAWLYRALDHLEADEAAWDLVRWQQDHKADFFAACRGWMHDCPPVE